MGSTPFFQQFSKQIINLFITDNEERNCINKRFNKQILTTKYIKIWLNMNIQCMV